MKFETEIPVHRGQYRVPVQVVGCREIEREGVRLLEWALVAKCLPGDVAMTWHTRGHRKCPQLVRLLAAFDPAGRADGSEAVIGGWAACDVNWAGREVLGCQISTPTPLRFYAIEAQDLARHPWLQQAMLATAPEGEK